MNATFTTDTPVDSQRSAKLKQPPKVPLPTLGRLLLFRFAAIIYLAVAGNYLWWRWTESINPDAMIFSVTLYAAEFLMFIASLLMIFNYWKHRVIPPGKPVRRLGQMEKTIGSEQDRPIGIDVLIATYNEPLEIVSDTVRDARALRYKHPDVSIKIYLCDDGKRDGRDPEKENFKEFALSNAIEYFVREDNKGFKAGNLNHAFWQTTGDLIVVLDADTRVFPDFLNHLTGYFRDQNMAWVQSPQWFYDLPQGVTIKTALSKRFPMAGPQIARWIPFANRWKVGRDVFGTDPQIFYHVILFQRNASNAAFCCGAGSVHRRKALEQLIVNQKNVYEKYHSEVKVAEADITNKQLYYQLSQKSLGPFVHHVSEDIATSILMHADELKWTSYQHPRAECQMLSPQTLPAYVKQFSRYAEGTFSIFFSKINPVIKSGLSLPQRLAYFDTMLSYFSPVWIIVFLLSPIIFYFTLIPPLKAFNFDFFFRFLMLNICIQVLMTIAHLGLDSRRSEQYYIAGFWIKIRAFFKVVLGRKLTFNTTVKEKQDVRFRDNLPHILPHLFIVFFTLAGFGYNVYLIQINEHPSYSAFFANNIWAFFNIYQISPIIIGAFKSS